MKEFSDLKNRPEVLNSLGNASYSHGITAILKEEIQFLREGNKNKSIIMQDIMENKNLLLQNKDERNIQYNAYLNNNKSYFLSDEIFILYSKIFKMSQDTRNDKETNNVKLTNYFQALATANDIEDNIDRVSDSTFNQPANEGDRVNAIIGQYVRRKVKQNIVVRSFPEVKSNPHRIII